MEGELRNLLEKDKIIEVVNLLFLNTDKRNWIGVKNCLAERVAFDMQSMSGEPPQILSAGEIIEQWKTGLNGLEAIHHQVGNYIVQVNNHEAEVSCNGIACHYLELPTKNNTRIFVGSYNIGLKKTGQGWKVNLFTFNLKFVEGNKELTVA